jgi:dihydrofolate reductase
MELALIAAVAADGGIGRGNALLLSDPQDQRHFRSTTMGCPVVMGRRTWQSLPARFRPLPGRRNLVLSRDPSFRPEGAEVAPSLDAALARVADAPTVYVMGGADVYAQALPRADTLVLTEIGRSFDEADAFFPAWDRAAFDLVERHAASADDGTPLVFARYRRRGPAATA